MRAQQEHDEQYSDEDYLEQAYQQAVQHQNNSYNSPVTALGGSPQEENLIKWQLKVDEILEQADHLLRGHKVTFDNQGNKTWTVPTDPDEITLNDYGVSVIMRIMSAYVNQNTMLSNLDEKTINSKMYDFGQELLDLFFMEYDKMGMNTPTKIKKFMMLWRELVDMVHFTLLRALNAGERRSIHESISVTQSGPISGHGQPYQGMNNMPGRQAGGLMGRLLKGRSA